MALTTPYCTIQEATTFLGESEAWENAEKPERERALFWGRIWIDTHFSCDFAPDNAPDELKFANALLAEDWLEGKLITETAPSKAIKRKKVSAGAVSTETEYLLGGEQTVHQKDVLVLLSSICVKSGFGTKRLTRV